ncbi:hypothetical protein XA68_17571 [Ophiocordyceps unilateralis]|uniref:Uncharacterized protein n=1 Tax=Ophiocordyceps unilateralis TaxID=268505 RepID=A0A2A9P4D3_OPHUN|nr:hypothetical protein XA68_17571 [Ophiocordyceps unilateralis]
MASDQLAAKLRFLTDAAHLLRSSAPETSDHLMRHRSGLMSLAGLFQPQLQRQHVCSACGHIMVPGEGTVVRLETIRCRKRDAKASAAKASRGRFKVVTCGRCQRPTRIGLDAPGPTTKAAIAKAHTKLKAKTKTTGPCEAPKTSANASSKQRAKDRKAGLQALLSRQQPASAGSLTLADFMRK